MFLLLCLSASLQNSSRPAEGSGGECSAVPTHLHIHVWMGRVQGVPQTVIQAVEIRYRFLSSHYPDSKNESFSLMFELDVSRDAHAVLNISFAIHSFSNSQFYRNNMEDRV